MGDYPHLATFGRYAFFAVCAIGVAAVTAVVFAGLGVVRQYSMLAGNMAGVASFLALRDMFRMQNP